jgi:ABC-type branched-subunit amino acid transport system substrate-binding protein
VIGTRSSRGLGVLATAALVLAAAACSSSGGNPVQAAASAGAGNSPASAQACSGTPVKLMTIVPVTSPIQHEPEIPDSAKAAAEAVTKTCELGRPVQVISCDDMYNANNAAACGREAVADKVLAVVGSTGNFGDSYLPILASAGIPEVGSLTVSNTQNTSKLSFPLQNSVAILIACVNAAKSLGAKSVIIVTVDTSAVSQLVALVNAAIKAVGMKEVAPVLIPPTATDLNEYAANAASSGAGAIIPVLPVPLLTQLLTALNQQAFDFEKTPIIGGGTTVNTVAIRALSAAEGIYSVGYAWPATDPSNAGVAQYQRELAAAGESNTPLDDNGLLAWSTVNIIAGLLKGSSSPTPATLVAKLSASGLISRPEMAPTDFSKNPFPSSSPLASLRAFTDMAVLTKLEGGKFVPLTNGFVNFTTPFKVSG